MDSRYFLQIIKPSRFTERLIKRFVFFYFIPVIIIPRVMYF
jgi:hypothetical protein